MVFPLKRSFIRASFKPCCKLKFYCRGKIIFMRTTCVLELESSVKYFSCQKNNVLARSYSDFCRKLVLTNWCFFDVRNFSFDKFQGAFLSTVFLARALALFQQFVDDAGPSDGKKQDLTVAQSAKDGSATGPLQHHQFAIPKTHHVMPKTRGVM